MAVEIPAKETNETRHNSTPNGWQLTPMYETLIGLDNSTGKRYPALATEWAIEPDGNGYRFKLRQGVQFHKDQGEFTSKDLVQPWKEILKDDSISGVTEFWRQAIQDIQPVNDYEVVFRFKRPDGNFLDYVSDQLGGYEVWSKKNFDQAGPPTNLTLPALAGTGSYQYKERTQGQFVRFEAVPYKHWRHTPDFKEFEFRWIKEASTRIAALLAGEVHMAALPQDLEALVVLPGVGRKTASVVLGTWYGIPSGVVVDTHVKRLTNLLGLVRSDNPEIIERELMELVPQDEWINFSHRLIHHGRRTCIARRPQCAGCGLLPLCRRVSLAPLDDAADS